MGMRTKKTRKQAKQGDKKPKNKEKKPSGGKGRKKTKIGVFMKWPLNLLAQLNSLNHINGNQNRFDRH